MRRVLLGGLFALGLWACDDDEDGPDAGAVTDMVAVDGAAPDGAAPDSAAPDSAPSDSAAPDSAPPDSAPPDSAPLDMAPDGMPDAAPDMAPPDAAPDAMAPDMAPLDMAPPDAMAPDMTPPDAGPECVAARDDACDGVDGDCDGIIDEAGIDDDLGQALGVLAWGPIAERAPSTPGCGDGPTPTARYRWTAPAAGRYRVDTAGSDFDTVLELRVDTCDEMPPCNDDQALGDVRSAVEIDVEEGDALVIAIGGYGPDATGHAVVSVHPVVDGPADDADFSPIAQAALASLREGHAADEGSTWARSVDAVLPVDWLVQMPHARDRGRPAAEIEAAPAVAPDAPEDSYHPDFALPYCEADADCERGRCQTIAATVERVGDLPRKLCIGPADHVWDDMYRALARTRSFADVSSLDFPDNPAGTEEIQRGRFLIALRNALRYLHDTGDPIEVRFLFGWLVNDFAWDDQLADRVAALTEGIPPETALRLYFAAMNHQFFSWNHSKIIAADGEVLLQGGINFYSADYLGAAPVQDVSMQLYGTPARDGHRYLDAIWTPLVDDLDGLRGDADGTFTTMVTVPPDIEPPIEAPLPDAEPRPRGVRVVSMGRLGLLDRDGVVEPSPSDDAMLAAIAAAQSSLAFSLQDLGSVRDGVIIDVPIIGEIDLSYGWPVQLMRILADRAIDGVEVSIIISETGAGFYSYGWTKRDALEAWRDIIESSDDLDARAIAAAGSATDLLCDRINFASVRVDDEADRWAGDLGMGNHSKFWIVDDQALYIGSQNLYLSNLFEWGLLVDDAANVRQARASYWDPLWAASSRSAVSGPAADGRCVLRDPPM